MWQSNLVIPPDHISKTLPSRTGNCSMRDLRLAFRVTEICFKSLSIVVYSNKIHIFGVEFVRKSAIPLPVETNYRP